MATIGLSRPYFAKYAADGTAVSYSAGALLGKYTELSVSLTEPEDNDLYADNGPDETDTQFTGGTAEITTNDLLADVMMSVLGLTTEQINAEGMTSENPVWMLFDDDQVIPYIGLGGIIQKKIKGEIKYQAYVLPKIQPSNPGLSVTTKGKTITWQTPRLSCKILRSDEPKHRWYMLSSILDSEEDAAKAIRAYLNIAEATA